MEKENVRNEDPLVIRRQGYRMFSEEERNQLKEKFLEVFDQTCNISAACRQIGIDRSLVRYWKEHDASFMVRFTDLNADATDRLLAEAVRRATEGDDEYVVSMGKLVMGPEGNPLTTRKRSDRLLELLLKARLPEFRDKQTDVNVNVNIDQARESLMNKLAALPEPTIETTVTEIREDE